MRSRWDRLEELFEEALELSGDERAAFVARQTADDPALRSELQGLLAAAEPAPDYVDRLRQEILGSGLRAVLQGATPVEATTDPRIGCMVSHYQILDRMGRGGMGVVYRAHDRALDRTVALKCIAPGISRDAEARERLLREARAASALEHPNICTIHEIAEADDGLLFIVMPAYTGETLGTRIARGPLSEPDALAIAEPMARALAAAHAAGILHRDVKPANVFITQEGVVKLLDFGLARTSDATITEPGVIRGTVGYLSPEQVRGEPADAASDVWALGVIIFEMLTGHQPFAADNHEATIHLILSREPDLRARRPDVAGQVEALVGKALAKDRGRRFANGSEILEALRACRTEPTTSTTTRRRSARGRILASATAVAVLIIGILAGRRWAVGPTHRTGPPLPLVSHVLWVDDNPENNAAIILRLREHGVQVTTAVSTAEGLERFDPDAFQLVISDMGRFEGENGQYVGEAGMQLLEQLRTRHEGVQLVFCTSPRSVRMHREAALAAGAVNIVADCEEILPLIGL